MSIENLQNNTGKKILIIDDDPLISEPYAFVLREDGFNVRTVEDCMTAEEKMRELVPDLIILDLVMAYGESGFEFLKVLKRSRSFNRIPVIVVSSLGRPEDIEKCRDLGATAYMVKSKFSADELTHMIETHASTKQQSAD